ncbi:hypothetical protein [Puniceibacterium confluentis]|uniref:hypothetical protein n=1 Tax=Puniceibacterium confluentis TaxID=1958944 RepID=UPI0011B6CEB2|nr:hypothetical protein [Puniceibacterium confluentis]
MTIANQALEPIEKTSRLPFQLTTATVLKSSAVAAHNARRAAGGEGKDDAVPDEDGQSYIERVRNYIPLEVIAFFIFANSMVAAGDGGVASLRAGAIGANEFVALASFCVALIGTVFYVKMAADAAKTGTWGLHAVLSCVAFAIWAYAMKAEVWDVLGIPISPVISGFLLGTFTLFSGLFVPVKSG